MRVLLLVSAPAVLPLTSAAGSGVIELGLYRATAVTSIQRTIENVDLASLAGVLSYVQTEVVGEHFLPDYGAGKTAPKEGGFVPECLGLGEANWTVDVDSPLLGLADANEVQLQNEHADELDPVAKAGGAGLEMNWMATFLGALRAPQWPDDAPGVGRRQRTERHKGVDVIFRSAFKVKNTHALLASQQVSQVDFGPDVGFENGQAKRGGFKWDYGDFVGASWRVDQRTPQVIPGYWFSVSGICPNLPWEEKGSPEDLNPQCIVHPSGTGKLLGGLCPKGTTADAVPTGEIGCTYTYQPPVLGSPDVLRLDDLAGITKEDCGGRPCKDWKDFRKACTNNEYKQIFNYGRRRVLTRSKYCIEYDVHPACVDSCSSKECKALKDSDKDVGLPFWRGRCSAAANLNRTEQLAMAFSIPGAGDGHETVEPWRRENARTCLGGEGSETCRGNPQTGFTYCTREWSGVCEACYIPGIGKEVPHTSQDVACPWAVLGQQDYVSSNKPACRTSQPRDYCCLYVATCNMTIPADPADVGGAVPLDEDGYAAVAAARSTKAMATFLHRYHSELFGGKLLDEAALRDLAYWEWGKSPHVGRSLASAAQHSRHLFLYTTTTTTTSPARTSTSPTQPTTLPPAPVKSQSASEGAWPGLALALLFFSLLR